MIGHRTDDLFVTTAKKAGRVVALDNEVITVEFEDGSKKSVPLGRRFGVSAGATIPHHLETDLKMGDRVAIGDTIAYNRNYFQKDSIYKNQVLWKAGVLTKTALFESTQTFEDSCEISKALSEKLKTEMTHVRVVKVAFDQQVRNLVKVGDSVDIESILCTIENSSEGNSEIFDEESLNTLRLLGNLTPRAKHSGVVERIEVLYHGDLEDMSDSLRVLSKRSDREMTERNRKLNKPAIVGYVDGTYRIDGSALEMDSLAIKVYITGPVAAASGDKAVFGNQLKTTVGRVMTGVNKTRLGEPIDAIFGYRSINDRIVNSAALTGTTNTLLRLLSRLAVQAYKS